MVEWSKFLPSLFDVAVGVSSSIWFLTVVTVPWDLYYKTRETRERVDSEEQKEELKTWERGLLGVAISSHVLSALAAYGIAKYSDEQILRKRTSLVFLFSGLIRPINAYQTFVQSRLHHLEHSIPFPENLQYTVQRELENVSSIVHQQDNNLNTWNESGKSKKFESVEEQLENVHERSIKLLRDIHKETEVLKTLAETTAKNIIDMREKALNTAKN